jgi:hypothetical protein
VGLELLPEARDVLLQRGLGVLGGVLAPQLVDEPVGRDDFARVEQQDRENAALLGSAETDLPVPVSSRKGSEDAEFEAAGQGANVPRLSARR